MKNTDMWDAQNMRLDWVYEAENVYDSCNLLRQHISLICDLENAQGAEIYAGVTKNGKESPLMRYAHFYPYDASVPPLVCWRRLTHRGAIHKSRKIRDFEAERLALIIHARVARNQYCNDAADVICDIHHVHDVKNMICSYLEAIFPEPDRPLLDA